MIWFTADTHFDHASIIRHSKRPFPDVEAMNETMIARWNERVRPGDIVYHLSDFSLSQASRVQKILLRLVGEIHLIRGNHDRKNIKGVRGFADVKDYKTIKVGEQSVVMCHYAFRTWHGSHRGAWDLHGHSHGTLKRDYGAKQLDVGVDCWDFRPISFDEVAEEMKKSTFKSVDHHGRR